MSALGMSPEQYAARLLRESFDSDRSPDIRHIADESAMTVREVEALRDKLLAGRYREPGRNVAPVALVPPLEDWRKGIGHPVARIARKAAKVEALIAEVLADLDAETGRDKLRQREQRLAAELAKVRAEIKGTTAAAPATELQSCSACGWSGKRLASHNVMAHGGAAQ